MHAIGHYLQEKRQTQLTPRGMESTSVESLVWSTLRSVKTHDEVGHNHQLLPRANQAINWSYVSFLDRLFWMDYDTWLLLLL